MLSLLLATIGVWGAADAGSLGVSPTSYVGDGGYHQEISEPVGQIGDPLMIVVKPGS